MSSSVGRCPAGEVKMSNSGGIIKAPVSIEDIRQLIGASSFDLGTLCKSDNINKWSIHKPVRSSLISGNKEDIEVPANYGWDILSKSPAENTSSFIDSIKASGVNYDYWKYNKPRGFRGGDNGENEWYRILDFEAYNHYQKALGSNDTISRVTITKMSIAGEENLLTIPKNGRIDRTFESSSFRPNSGFNIQIDASIVDPTPDFAKYNIHWDVEGTLWIVVLDSNNRTVASDEIDLFNINLDNTARDGVLRISAYDRFEEYDAPYRVQYRVLFNRNETYYMDAWNKIYVPITVRINVSEATTFTKNRLGIDGVYIRRGIGSSWPNDVFNRVFGECTSQIVVIEVSNGSDTQRVLTFVPISGLIPFERVGITIRPRPAYSKKDVVLYLLYGNFYNLFPDYQTSKVDYGPVSIADKHKIMCAPFCYKEIGIIDVEPGEMSFVNDFNGYVSFTFIDGSTDGGEPNDNGVTGITKIVRSLTVRWDYGVLNNEETVTVSSYLQLMDIDGNIIAETGETSNIPRASDTRKSTRLTYNNPNTGGYAPFEIYALMWFDVDGERLYVNFKYPNNFTEEKPIPYRLGWD